MSKLKKWRNSWCGQLSDSDFTYWLYVNQHTDDLIFLILSVIPGIITFIITFI